MPKSLDKGFGGNKIFTLQITFYMQDLLIKRKLFFEIQNVGPSRRQQIYALQKKDNVIKNKQ